MNYNYVLLRLALVICNYTYNNIPHLEQQIADLIIRRNVIIEQHRINYEQSDDAELIPECYHRYYDICHGKELLNQQTKKYRATQEQLIRAELKGATESVLIQQLLENEEKILALKRPLLEAYYEYNWNTIKTGAKYNAVGLLLGSTLLYTSVCTKIVSEDTASIIGAGSLITLIMVDSIAGYAMSYDARGLQVSMSCSQAQNDMLKKRFYELESISHKIVNSIEKADEQ